jgi:hypothetical protein
LQPGDLGALLRVDLHRLVEGAHRALGLARQHGDVAITVEDELFRFDETLLDLGQPVFDGLLENAPRVIGLFQVRPETLDLPLQIADAGVAPVEFDDLASPGDLGLACLQRQLVDPDGECRPQTITVGRDFRLGQRHRPFQPVDCEPLDPTPIERCQQKHQEASPERPEQNQHRGLDGDHSGVPTSPGSDKASDDRGVWRTPGRTHGRSEGRALRTDSRSASGYTSSSRRWHLA